MTLNTDTKTLFSQIGVKILVCFLLLLQLFPPLWVQDVTSLRHFMIALFDIATLALITAGVFQKKIPMINPLKFFPYIVFLSLVIWMAISISWAMNRVEGIAVLNSWMLIFLTSVLVSVLLNNNSKVFHVLVYCTMAVTLVNVLTCIIGYYYFDLHISQRRNLMLNGGYGNKNIFAVCLLLKLPLLYYAVLRYKRVFKIISLVLIFAVCFCLVILSTRSTFIGLFGQLIILFVYALFQKFRFKSKNTHILYISITMLCAIGGFFAANKFIQYNYNKYASHNVQNNYTIAARVQTIEQGNSKGRLLIWKNTSEIIKMNPIFGYGIGNHKLNIMRVEAKKKTNYVVSDHAHNDFLEMQSELGVIGELLYLLLYIGMFVCGLKIMYSQKTKEDYRLIALSSLLMLITYMNDAVFNFPNERATPQIYLALSIALMSFAWFKTKREVAVVKPYKIVLPVVCIVMIGALYIETCHFISSVVQHQRILCHNSNNKNHIPPSHWVNVSPWLPNVDESTKPIAINNAMMFALEGDYRTAVNMILADNSNPYYALKEYRLASYYSHLDMTDSSDYWADKCIKMKPLCYDPVSVKIGNRRKEGDTKAQIRLLEDYLQREKNEERAWLSLINIYLSEEDYLKAEEIYKQFCVDNNENERFLRKKSEIEALKERKEQQKR